MVEISLERIYEENRKMLPEEPVEKVCEATLSIVTGGLFDAIEGYKRTEAIEELKDILNLT